MKLREVIARNTVFNAAGRSWEAFVSLFLIAYIVARIGVEHYGLWALVASFTGYAALLDLGVGSAYAKYIAQHSARRERERISSVVSTGFFYYLAFGVVFVLVTWVGVEVLMWLLGLFAGSSALGAPGIQADLEFLLKWSLVLFAAGNCIAPFTAVQTGLQRMGVTNLVSGASSIVKVTAVVAFLETGYGLRGLVYANTIVLAFFGVLSVCATFVVCPYLRIAPWRASWPMFRRLFGFGWRTQVSRLANLVTFETDVVIIALVLLDLELAGLYRIGIELANKMRQIPVVLMSAIVPAASHLDANADGPRLQRLYLRATKYIAAITIPLALFVAGSAGLLMTAWQGAGAQMAAAVVVLRIMAIGYVANILPGPGVAVALGMGQPGLQMRAGLISMGTNLVLTLALALSIGFWGVPIATVLSMAISWRWFQRAMAETIDLPPGTVFEVALRGPLFAVAAPAAFVVACDVMATGLLNRFEALWLLAAVLVIFTGLYLTLLRRTSFFEPDDFDFFERTLHLNHLPGYSILAGPVRQG